MLKLALISSMLVLAMPVSSSAVGSARWIGQPSCVATATGLTCTARAAGLQPQSIAGLSSLQAAVSGTVRYTCSDPVFDVFFRGFPFLGGFPEALAETDVHNGLPFLVQFSPTAPPFTEALVNCRGTWTHDPSYYDVQVKVGWGYGSGRAVDALVASIGTVSPG